MATKKTVGNKRPKSLPNTPSKSDWGFGVGPGLAYRPDDMSYAEAGRLTKKQVPRGYNPQKTRPSTKSRTK